MRGDSLGLLYGPRDSERQLRRPIWYARWE